MQGYPEVTELYETTGATDFLLRVAASDVASYHLTHMQPSESALALKRAVYRTSLPPRQSGQ